MESTDGPGEESLAAPLDGFREVAQSDLVRGTSAERECFGRSYFSVPGDGERRLTKRDWAVEDQSKRLDSKEEGAALLQASPSTSTVDVMEVCAPWDSPLVTEFQRMGGTGVRTGLHNGFDLSTKSGLRRAVVELRRLRPRLLWCSPPCTDWSAVTNAQSQPHQRERLMERRRKSRRILEACEKLIAIQVRELDGSFAFEHPLMAQSWSEECCQRIVSLGEGRFRVDGCRYGMVSSKTRHPVLKAWGIVSNHGGLRQHLPRVCRGHHESHERLEGTAVSASAVYPQQMCRQVAWTLLRTPPGLESTRNVESLLSCLHVDEQP